MWHVDVNFYSTWIMSEEMNLSARHTSKERLNCCCDTCSLATCMSYFLALLMASNLKTTRTHCFFVFRIHIQAAPFTFNNFWQDDNVSLDCDLNNNVVSCFCSSNELKQYTISFIRNYLLNVTKLCEHRDCLPFPLLVKDLLPCP